ncbi:uncharacterized protein EAF01_007022 [Botrytis porri]|uniref:uncharacterized protein n=1 Tax=Botrytis porri TaxID=87229 RepID=UPI00190295C1|nr:uncharacterized protein EAF01_007022 [Botrytis porri]KAF7901723.1 hypothetical protein EAF01_007022 [Botrytis porri]
MDLAASRVVEESDKACTTGILSKCPPLGGHYLLNPGPKEIVFRGYFRKINKKEEYCPTMFSRVHKYMPTRFDIAVKTVTCSGYVNHEK